MNKTPTLINTQKETHGFLWFMTLVLVGVLVWAVIDEPKLQEARSIIPLFALLGVHVFLHWKLYRFLEKPSLSYIYMVIQGAITLAFILITHNIGIVFGFSLALVGEAIGAYGISVRGILITLFYLLVSLASYLWSTELPDIGLLLISTAPMLLFVIVYVELYTRQTRANERAQQLLEQLETANRQLTDYAAQVEDLTITSERQRMARELHDTLSQGLAGLILQLEAADAHLANNKNDKARQVIQQTMATARTTLADARTAIDDLRQSQPPNCREALQKIATEFSKNTGIPCDTELRLPDGLDASISYAVIRIAAEAFSNITQHARATQAAMKAVQTNTDIMIEITDDGTGFDPDAVPSAGHYGLVGMQERVRLLYGSLSIDCQPGKGTTLRIRIPLS